LQMSDIINLNDNSRGVENYTRPYRALSSALTEVFVKLGVPSDLPCLPHRAWLMVAMFINYGKESRNSMKLQTQEVQRVFTTLSHLMIIGRYCALPEGNRYLIWYPGATHLLDQENGQVVSMSPGQIRIYTDFLERIENTRGADKVDWDHWLSVLSGGGSCPRDEFDDLDSSDDCEFMDEVELDFFQEHPVEAVEQCTAGDQDTLVKYFDARAFPVKSVSDLKAKLSGDVELRLGVGADPSIERDDGEVWSIVSPILPALYAHRDCPVRILDVGGYDGRRADIVQAALKNVVVEWTDLAGPFPSRRTKTLGFPCMDHRLLRGTYDIITLNMVLHHVKRPNVSFVRGLAKLLRPGGYLVIREHDWDGSMSQRRFFDAMHSVWTRCGQRHSACPPSRYYSQETMIRMFSRCGFLFAPIVHPTSNVFYPGGGMSKACCLTFIRGPMDGFYSSMRMLAAGKWCAEMLQSDPIPYQEFLDLNPDGVAQSLMTAASRHLLTDEDDDTLRLVHKRITKTTQGRKLMSQITARRYSRQGKDSLRVAPKVPPRLLPSTNKDKDGPLAPAYRMIEQAKSHGFPEITLAPSEIGKGCDVPELDVPLSKREIATIFVGTLTPSMTAPGLSPAEKARQEVALNVMYKEMADDRPVDLNAGLAYYGNPNSICEAAAIMFAQHMDRYLHALQPNCPEASRFPAGFIEAARGYIHIEGRLPPPRVVWVWAVLVGGILRRDITPRNGRDLRGRLMKLGINPVKQHFTAMLYGLVRARALVHVAGSPPIYSLARELRELV
jgi:hypothetical protein